MLKTSNIYIRMMLLLLAAGAVAGCEFLYFLGGKDDIDALYVIPKGKRVLVLVDVRPEISVPPTFAAALDDQIAAHLFKTKAVDLLVRQEPLIDLQANPVAYAKMGVADIAHATGAEVVVVVYIVDLAITSSTDNTVIQGTAQAQVKVVDQNGTRLWPGEPEGQRVEAHVDPAFATDHSREKIYKLISTQFARRIGKMFHAYNPEDPEMHDPRK